MTIEEEQARAMREAMARAEATDAETLRDIIRITQTSNCGVCRAIHSMVVDRTSFSEDDRAWEDISEGQPAP